MALWFCKQTSSTGNSARKCASFAGKFSRELKARYSILSLP